MRQPTAHELEQALSQLYGTNILLGAYKDTLMHGTSNYHRVDMTFSFSTGVLPSPYAVANPDWKHPIPQLDETKTTEQDCICEVQELLMFGHKSACPLPKKGD